ncbi:MAG: S41 family peptidase [Methylophilaceae bacterium]
MKFKPMLRLINSAILPLGLLMMLSSTAIAQDNPVTPEELRAFTDALTRIKSKYVEPVGNKKLIDNAIAGMVSGLDPHSTYLSAQEYEELHESASGKFAGLGFEVSMEKGLVKVISPIDDTPAQRAGILPGDLIVRINSTPVEGLSLTEAVKMMRGDPGTQVLLTLVRKDIAAPLKLPLVRAIINIVSVKSRMLEKGYGYLRISSFQELTGQQVNTALAKLKKENNGKLKGLVLDLRNNPGGLLHAAVEVSDAFLKSGEIVSMNGRAGHESGTRFSASADDLIDDAALVVLINSGSASAAEIVAGALQDNKRAVIMGDPSFGKGSVQTVLTMSNGSALKLTTSRYYTPSGRSIQAEGIQPDIKLANVKLVSSGQTAEDTVKEADLSRHLEQGHTDQNTAAVSADAAASSAKASDYPLNEALTLLKGLSIIRR